MLHSDGWSNDNSPSDVVNVFQPAGRVADPEAVAEAGLSVAVGEPVPGEAVASEAPGEALGDTAPPAPGDAGPQPDTAITTAATIAAPDKFPE